MKRCLVLALCALFSGFFSVPARAGDFIASKTTAKNPLYIHSANGKSKTFSVSKTDRSLEGTGLFGTVADRGDHWQITITGGSLRGNISTQSGLRIVLRCTSTVIATGNYASHGIWAKGGLSILGPGVLHIDNNKNNWAIETSGFKISGGAVVGINHFGSGFAVHTGGLTVVGGSLHVQSLAGSGICCHGNGRHLPSPTSVSIRESIVTVLSKENALTLQKAIPMSVSFSTVHFVSTKGWALDNAGGTVVGTSLGSGASVYVSSSLFCAAGGRGGFVCGLYGAANQWAKPPRGLHFDNVVGLVAGGKVGVAGVDRMTVSGTASKLAFAGNLAGSFSSGSQTGISSAVADNNAIRMYSKKDSLFRQKAGSVKLFAPATKAFSKGDLRVEGGSFEVTSDLKYGDFQTHFTVAGIAGAAETVAASALGDWICADLALAQSLTQIGAAVDTILSAKGKPKTAVGAACDTIGITGGTVRMDVSSCGMTANTVSIGGGATSIACSDSSGAVKAADAFYKTRGSLLVNGLSWVPSYTVKFAANGGAGTMAAQTMAVGRTTKLQANRFYRTGFVFLGWSKTKTGSVVYPDAKAVKDLAKRNGTVTLYAKWAKKSYKVAFYANGGKGKMTAQTMTYGKSAKLKANQFKRKGYAFKGWAKRRYGAVVYKNGQFVKNLVKNGSTVKLYAVWKKK